MSWWFTPVLSALFMATTACGGSGNGGSSTPGIQASTRLPSFCPQPIGAYVTTLDVTSGNCKLQPHIEKLGVIGEPSGSRCHILDAHATPLPNGCRYEETQSCFLGEIVIKGTMTLDIPQDLADLRGNYVIQAEEDGRRCISTYSARLQKAGSVR
jgi:hypothetical protein